VSEQEQECVMCVALTEFEFEMSVCFEASPHEVRQQKVT
jgi:hypothetical protein